MSKARTVWALVFAMATGAAVVVACSEGGHGTGYPLAKGAGATPTLEDGEVIDNNEPDVRTTGGDGGADCGTFTTGLHTDGGPFCKFVAGGGNKTCDLGQHCCMYAQGSGDSTCNNAGDSCLPAVDAGGADFECDEPSDCTGGKKCCFVGTVTKDPACSNKARFEDFRGTYCAASCKSGDLPVCISSSDCGGSGTCRSTNPKSKTVWVCVP